MKIQSGLAAVLLLSLTFVACVEPDDGIGEVSQSLTVGDAYSAIKALEANFPLPTPTLDTVIGTFNGSTGAYTGYESEYETIIDDRTGKPKTIRIIPHVDINAVSVGVRFNITNRGTQAVTLTANGVTKTAPAGQSYVVVNVGMAETVNWTLTVGTRTKSDTFYVDRPYFVGAGAFTVPAMPISIIYEPPQDSRLLNRATYSVTTSLANTMTMSIKESTTTTKEAKPQKYQNVADIKVGIKALHDALALVPNVPNKTLIRAGLDGISTVLGDVESVQDNGHANESETALTFVTSTDIDLSTNAHLGPGRGDRIVFLRNARFVWVSVRGEITIALLGYDSHSTLWVEQLRSDLASFPPLPMRNEGNGPLTGLDRWTIIELLALDPFVAGGPMATLDPSRFVAANPPRVTGSGGDDSYTLSHGVVASDRTASSIYRSMTTQTTAGLLAFAGIGVTETSTMKMTSTHTQSQQLTMSEIVSTTLEAHAIGDEQYSIDIFYDRIFGGFAFRQAPAP